jgi:hypothetical protein
MFIGAFFFGACVYEKRMPSVSDDPFPRQRLVLAGFNDCMDDEVRADIEYSFRNVAMNLPEIDSSYFDSGESGACGYKLIRGSDTLDLRGALTDVDLRDQAKAFFRIK